MRVKFNQGVPKACIDWLWQNVGSGNVIHSAEAHNTRREKQDSDIWFYERIFVEPQDPRSEGTYVPTITIKDPNLATMFALRWSNEN